MYLGHVTLLTTNRLGTIPPALGHIKSLNGFELKSQAPTPTPSSEKYRDYPDNDPRIGNGNYVNRGNKTTGPTIALPSKETLRGWKEKGQRDAPVKPVHSGPPPALRRDDTPVPSHDGRVRAPFVHRAPARRSPTQRALVVCSILLLNVHPNCRILAGDRQPYPFKR
jgi:hypothetical protein